MGVPDTEVHSLMRKLTEKNGCHTDHGGRVQAEGYWAPDRIYHEDGSYTPTQKYIINCMSRACRAFYLWSLPCCAGCTDEKDFDYEQRMRAYL